MSFLVSSTVDSLYQRAAVAVASAFTGTAFADFLPAPGLSNPPPHTAAPPTDGKLSGVRGADDSRGLLPWPP
jgi:hypothetical protein